MMLYNTLLLDGIKSILKNTKTLNLNKCITKGKNRNEHALTSPV